MSNKIILEDFSEGDGYYKVDLAYLSKEQVKEIEDLVSKWKLTDEDIKACIGMCLTDVNEQRFKDYGTSLRDCLAWLEKQGDKPTLCERFKNIKKSEWFKKTHEGMSVSDDEEPKWTGEDNEMLLDAIDAVNATANGLSQVENAHDIIVWLKSLKQRMEQ